MRLDQLFKENDTTVKTMSMPEKVAAFDRLQPGQEVGLWFDSVIRRADKYKPFVVGRKTRSKLRPLEKITLLQKSKDGGTGGMKYYLYKRADNTSFQNANVSLAMGDMAASLVDIKESRAFIDLDESIKEATIMERIVLDIDYSRNPEALVKAINLMGKRLDLTLMNAPQALDDLKQKGFARIEGKDSDIMSFVNYLYSKGIEPNYNIQNMDKVQTPGLNKNKAMPAFIGKKKVPVEETSKLKEVKLAGNSIADKEGKNPKEVEILGYTVNNPYEDDPEEDDGYRSVYVEHDGPWTIYGDSAFENWISDLVDFDVEWSESGMQEDGMAHLEGYTEPGSDFDEGASVQRQSKAVEEGMMDDEVKAILMKYPKELAKLKASQDLMDVYDTPLYQELFSYYADSGEMPYGTMKARDGDPVQFIQDELDDMGVFEGFASDAQRKAAFASGYDPKKKKKVKEGHSNARHQAQTMLKLEELRDMIMVLDMDDDSKTSALTALDQVADDITILESKDGANTSDGKHQEKICRDTVRNPNKSMLGGPSPEEAEKTLKSKFGYSDEKISKLKEEQKIEEQAPHTHPITEAEFDEAAGEKDACYHKVKSRYKVWPSAYASGALVKCRKVGAKNWGNSKKK